MILRDYQSDSVSSAWDFMRANEDGNPLIVIPTGGGKTPVMAELIRHAVKEWEGRIIVLSHVKELIQQTADKLRQVAPDVAFGIHSAGIGSRDTDDPVVIAQIQSAYKTGAPKFGSRDLVIVDEAHMIPPDGDGMYRQFIGDLRTGTPHARVIGLTATPYRTASGSIYGPDRLFSDICYEISVTDLIGRGFLCPLITTPVAKDAKADLSGVGKRGGEFIEAELSRACLRGTLVDNAVDDMIPKAEGRKSILVFAVGVAHADAITATLRARGEVAAQVDGSTPSLERGWTVEEFKSGAIRWLVNIGCFTTGFDAPCVDCVVMLRPTMSTGLYYQMVGRGFRISPSKENTLILDYGGNIARHGPVDAIKPPKARLSEARPNRICKECGEECHPDCPSCPSCGHVFTKECQSCHEFIPIGSEICPICNEDQARKISITHETKAHTGVAILSTQIIRETHQVGDVIYSKHVRRRLKPGETPATPTMKVEYMPPGSGPEGNLSFTNKPVFTEYVCIEHEGFAKSKAQKWWKKRSNDPFPATVDQAVMVAENGGLAFTTEITLKIDPKKDFPELVSFKMTPLPEIEHDPTGTVPADVMDDLPF